ncbi:hypothetical protein EmuJ_000007600 [Echinococcus multilocularis]|uniref:Uncharacterized protein n=1 Tax=Echinococcus multilocularis TaxID=6211 RepID=A0A087VWH7_ECHMU|nr:hypothetical protein EmuJ_000007600 [Echinococcus multilocularis]
MLWFRNEMCVVGRRHMCHIFTSLSHEGRVLSSSRLHIWALQNRHTRLLTLKNPRWWFDGMSLTAAAAIAGPFSAEADVEVDDSVCAYSADVELDSSPTIMHLSATQSRQISTRS